LADVAAAKLARVPPLVVVQRVRLEEVIGEQTLQLSAQVADALHVKVGRPSRSRLYADLNSGFELSFSGLRTTSPTSSRSRPSLSTRSRWNEVSARV